ncbi:MAG TPA: hypothetical protein VMI73_03830 [Trebonia sp.]|nr:hypothetical protein [Trebonia sp.]
MKIILGRGLVAAAGAALCLLASVIPAGAAQSTGSAPVVKSFRVNTKSVPAAGGKILLSAVVKGGSSCVFSSSPGLKGLPAKIPCGSGTAVRSVALPANKTAGQQSYKFSLTVSGGGHKVVTKPLTVVVREAPPGIAKITLTPADLPSAGGATVLSAAVSRSAKCTVSASPAIDGLPVTKACAAGSVAVRVSVPVTLPALSGAAAQGYHLTLTVSGPGGTSSSSASGKVWSAMKFSAPVSVDAPAGWIGTVSCVSAAFCMGFDLATGSAERWNGSGWSAPVRFETGPYLNNGYNIHASCASVTFCLAVDTSGNSFRYNGASWSPAASVGLNPVGVSCASEAFCVAIDATRAVTFTGSGWSAPVTVAATDVLKAVSCTSDSFCMAVSAAGMAYAYSAAGWDAGTQFDVPFYAIQVSCASAGLCAAVDRSGHALLYNGSWSAPTTLSDSPMNDVSCARGTSFCMALSNGSYYTTDGTAWSGAQVLDKATPSVLSCASATSCMVTDGSTIFVLKGTSWTSSPVPGGPKHGFTYAVSCPARSFCMAVDWSGAYLTYNGETWSAPQTISSVASAVDAVSCTSPSFCMAVDASNANGLGGHVFIFDGQSWKSEGQDGLPLSSVSCTDPSFCEMLSYGTSSGGVYTATWNGTSIGNGSLDTWLGFGPQPGQGEVSCASRTFCAAVDHLGNAFTFNGSTWSSATALDPGLAVTMIGVSCPSARFCAAIDTQGHEYTFNGSTWTAPATIDSVGMPDAISCTATRFCLMGDLSGYVASFNGATWSGTSNVDPVTTAGTGLTGVSCADAADCVAADWEGNALAGTG